MDPTFVLDHPLSESPLAKEHRDKPFLAERFELFVGGCELVNAYTEQNDPDAQREAFRRQSVRYNYKRAIISEWGLCNSQLFYFDFYELAQLLLVHLMQYFAPVSNCC